MRPWVWSPRRVTRLKRELWAESVVLTGSARCTNEETWIFQKFFRAVFGHNHVDHCARLVTRPPTVAGLAAAFGSGE